MRILALLLIMVLSGCQSMAGAKPDASGKLAARGGGDPYLAWQRGR